MTLDNSMAAWAMPLVGAAVAWPVRKLWALATTVALHGAALEDFQGDLSEVKGDVKDIQTDVKTILTRL